jgi:hypothetical protein
MNKVNIVVIDGQGGRLGKNLIAAIRGETKCDPRVVITAIGSNAAATSSMMSAGADGGATGENPVRVACADADIIAGPVGILCANAMLGEITPDMARAVGSSGAKKILVPVNKCDIIIAGASDKNYGEYVKLAAELAAREAVELLKPI